MNPDTRREHECLLKSALAVHTKIPVSKGSGHSSVEHICACYAHASLPEIENLDHWRLVLAEHISITTDFGVEAGIQGFQVSSPLDVLVPQCCSHVLK